MSELTETQYAVDDLRVNCCATCVLQDYNGTPCGLLRRWRLFRELPAEWTFDNKGVIVCADWFAAPPKKN